MKIKSIRIENFRSFDDTTIDLHNYSCFVGANGAGKSNVLAALNLFFCESTTSRRSGSALDLEDFHHRNADVPIRITLTFSDLSADAKEDLAAYVRNDVLIVTAEASYDAAKGEAKVRHFGQRYVMADFARFFDAEKEGKRVPELKDIYTAIGKIHTGLPASGTKAVMLEALQAYESAHPEMCELLPSVDSFYGVNSTGMLAKFLTWVYIPAVKDAGDESEEGKNTAFARLLERAIESRSQIDEDLEALRKKSVEEYTELLKKHEASLTKVSESLKNRLSTWSHPGVTLNLKWNTDEKKSVVVQKPLAGIQTGEDGFLGSLSRMGHGLQRSYLLALLQELAEGEDAGGPTLVLGVEEPELYQHPPQARHLASVFQALSEQGSQILVTTHSPYFVSGEHFEHVQVVRKAGEKSPSKITSLDYQNLCDRLRALKEEGTNGKNEGLIAKIHQSLQPSLAEMFFTKVLILVEGLEDVSFITTQFHVSGMWDEFRRLGCHIVPANSKDRLIRPLAIAQELGIRTYVVFDADGNCDENYKKRHAPDNKALMTLLGLPTDSLFPKSHQIENTYAIWVNNMGDAVDGGFDGVDVSPYKEKARLRHGQEPGLDKNDFFIADWVTAAYLDGHVSTTLAALCEKILGFARKS